MSPATKGDVVVFMGLDGVGKSTQAELLWEDLRGRGEKSVLIHHASAKVPGVRFAKQKLHRWAVGALKRRGAHVDWEREGVGGATKRSWLSSVISHWLVVGSFVKSVWYQWRYRGATLIFDRCFLDDVVKARWRFGYEGSLSRILMRKVSAPDILIVLAGDLPTSFDRKKARNCSFTEYKAKGRVLDAVLQQGEALGWKIVRIDVDGRNVADVRACIATTLAQIRARSGFDNAGSKMPEGTC